MDEQILEKNLETQETGEMDRLEDFDRESPDGSRDRTAVGKIQNSLVLAEVQEKN